MTLPYKPTTWSDSEPIDVMKLQQMTNNDQWLFENTPRMKYYGAGTKTAGVKVLGSRLLLTPRTTATGTADIYFGGFFSVGCTPIVTASVSSTNWQRRWFVAVNSMTGNTVPDHNGARITVTSAEVAAANQKIAANLYLNVQAIGW